MRLFEKRGPSVQNARAAVHVFAVHVFAVDVFRSSMISSDALAEPSREKRRDEEECDRHNPANRQPDEDGAAHPRPTGAAGRRRRAERHL
jgi:hypothetical protein